MRNTTRESYLKFYDRTIDRARDITESKGSDYSDNERDASADTFANFRASEAVGVSPETAILVRMLDKISRMGTAVTKAKRGDILRVNENIEETTLDLINYAVIFLAMLDEQKPESVAEERTFISVDQQNQRWETNR